MASDLYIVLARYVKPAIGHMVLEHYEEMDLRRDINVEKTKGLRLQQTFHFHNS